MNRWNQDIRERLFAEVCNTEKSAQTLEGVVHEQKENLSVVFRLSGRDEETGRDCELVTTEQMQSWGVDVETISRAAFENTINKRPPVLIDFQEACCLQSADNLLEPDVPLPETIDPERQFYLLTNNLDEKGAVYMFDDETMQKTAEKLGGNLVIIPASVHEAFVYPQEAGMGMDDARELARNANREIAAAVDYLSDEIYLYDMGRHIFTRVPEPQAELPDKVSVEQMQEYGYTWIGMLPLTQEKALELQECGLAIFALYSDGTEEMLFDQEEFYAHDGMFGVEKEAWRCYLEEQKQMELSEPVPAIS